MRANETAFWPESWMDPSFQRTTKPRRTGLTMMIDKGLGLHAFQDLLQLASPYIDVYKLGFGTSALYPLDVLRAKISLAREHGIDIMPGGTFCEVACQQTSFDTYLERTLILGYNAIEISDGTFPFSREERDRMISAAAEAGLTVYAEFGKKAEGFTAELDELVYTLDADLQAGASYTIVEARESGNVGIFNHCGEVDDTFLREVVQACGDKKEKLIWEAPQKNQQLALLRTLGYNVNLGNISTNDILSVEALRRGLRGDTACEVIAERSKNTCG
ncbi:MAG TPA: phosphosulfolactate synthase [Candidatus Bathyarchaeia archaeon]|nr:phosphosulfolactate synthase [Candidatus Bathyarchaeia archaeon]